ncbi:hypothetical protein [Tengunoibacter tsumagoiensis]|uniref:Uncharacterized protein n=1 Tax=Tengunoibacter tsumagoiensis TaxID=2014871 RepID=A0A402A2J1_9CHLR|nr:hypothetical protein [Tengunoibacter tsumagoiensis]GCE13344.1 hypothetical protein KTT_32030 [Tengunoibacter tsumagoiensis]
MKKQAKTWTSLIVALFVVIFVIIGLVENWSGDPNIRQYWIDSMLGIIFVAVLLIILNYLYNARRKKGN